jgi:hypothetical protein
VNLNGTPSNNVNGPGSGSVRIYLYTVTTKATDINEMQSVTSRVRCEPISVDHGVWGANYEDSPRACLFAERGRRSEVPSPCRMDATRRG